ncbi:beta-propeller fold lactonase family protein [Parasphaerochaeta coccoides]|nr:beta-propeller fold lactonase family protein [Parasphaerochaeta coccoides]
MKEKKELRWHGRVHGHGTGQYEIHYFLDGSGSFTNGNTRFTLKSGSFFVSPPQVVHSIQAEEKDPVTYYAVLLTIGKEEEKLCDVLDSLFASSPHMLGTNHRFFFEEIREKGLSSSALRRQEACHQLFSLLYQIAGTPEAITGSRDDHLIERALRFMQRHVRDSISLGDICGDLRLSDSYFIRLFKKRMHQAPMKHFMRLKVEAASALLTSTDKSIKEIAAHLSYSSEFHFSKQFKSHTGLSPSVYRSHYQQPIGYISEGNVQPAPVPRHERLRHHGGLSSPETQEPVDAFFLAGGYGTGDSLGSLHVLKVSIKDGMPALSWHGASQESVNPSYIAVDRKKNIVYAVNEIFTPPLMGSVSAFHVSTSLHLEQDVVFTHQGGCACHVSLSPDHDELWCCQYLAGTVTGIGLDEKGMPVSVLHTIVHEGSGQDSERQASPHPHCALPDPRGGGLYVADLGTDCLYRYNVKTWASPEVFRLPPGTGPRHLAVSQDGRFLYLVSELSNQLFTFIREKDSLHLIDTRELCPECPDASGETYAAGIFLAFGGRRLYVSLRGADEILIYDVDASSGCARLLQRHESGGAWPRSFSVDDRNLLLLAAHQKSHDITAWRLTQDGLFMEGEPVRISSPGAVCIVPLC